MHNGLKPGLNIKNIRRKNQNQKLKQQNQRITQKRKANLKERRRVNPKAEKDKF